MTGTYYLQSNKAAFNQNRIDPTCLVCLRSIALKLQIGKDDDKKESKYKKCIY
jgi:hypothetical protein